MKEAMGGISLFQIVVVFLLLFTGVMCMTINHSKAFGVKDEIINVIETEVLASYGTTTNYEINSDTVSKIVDLLNEVGYRITGKCPDGNWIGYDRNGNEVGNNSASFCIRAINVGEAYHRDLLNKCKRVGCTVTEGDLPSMVYYDVALFYQLDIPVIKDAFNLKLYGSTKPLFG